MTTRQLTVEEILNGTGLGRIQSVGHMSVIPLVDEGDAQDDTFAPPYFNASTRGYGSVGVENRSDRPTIVPTGTGWVTDQHAQDHATPGAKLMKPKERVTINQACCIQETQGGLIRSEQVNFVVLPAPVRVQAVASRNKEDYSRLWPHLRNLRKSMGYSGVGNLVDVLKHFEKELDEFVAEFELVPKQVGAVIIIGDRVVGIERAPTTAFWYKMWEPLIRVCYGSLAIQVRLKNRPVHRVALDVKEKSLIGIQRAISSANVKIEKARDKCIEKTKSLKLTAASAADGQMDKYKVITVASPQLSGQLVAKSRTKIPYASLCTS